MKKILFVIIVFCSLFLFIGCGDDNEAEMYNPQIEENNFNAIENQETVNVDNSDKMKHCYTSDKSQQVIYDYYYTSDKIYIGTEVEDSGFIEKIVTKNQICINDPMSQEALKGWNCISSTEIDFNDYMQSVVDMTESQMADFMKIKCETLDLDESKFLVE